MHDVPLSESAMFCTTGVRCRLELEGRLSVDLHLLQ